MIGIISDIHGNYEALKAVLEELDKMHISEIYCLGDVVGYFTQVNECCEELRERNIYCVMGNHDWYMVSGSNCMRSKSVNDCLNYQRTIISNENLAWIKSFPIFKQLSKVQMVHGGWQCPIDEYLLDPEYEYFKNIKGRVFISGHTHIPLIKKYKDKLYCNPGSVGQPRDNDNRASFATYNGSFKHYRVNYNIEAVCTKMIEAGFNDYYFGSLTTGAKRLHKLYRDN